ncbi:hypothetical protein CGLO_15978 [Colletotrichum gloeosporioides Cg-14]|uniref:Uncharacterized protein n=1 Tax=Colletotrichum gloeosporioides (strain Cg-14) TaxID=1237896 RepID=T0JPP2_COLGC|nr:hypothetical protein CGLO_15978 [Colletotrichum gloeosporioides Cg-14]
MSSQVVPIQRIFAFAQHTRSRPSAYRRTAFVTGRTSPVAFDLAFTAISYSPYG